jgi:hypothetical protein
MDIWFKFEQYGRLMRLFRDFCEGWNTAYYMQAANASLEKIS